MILTKRGVGRGPVGTLKVTARWKVAATLSCGSDQTVDLLSGLDMKSESADFLDFVEFSGFDSQQTSASLSKTEEYTGKVNFSMSTDCSWTLTITQNAYRSAPSTNPTLGNAPGCGATDLTRVKIPALGATPYVISDVYLAPTDPRWARFRLGPREPGTADTVTGFAHCTGSSWVVADYGSNSVGCQTVPQRLRSELDIKC